MTLNNKLQNNSGSVSLRNRWRIIRWVVGILVVVIGGVSFGVLYNIYVQRNFRCVVLEKVYRSGQPSAKNIENWAKEYGLKTVVNLRGRSDSEEYRNVIAKADQLGLNHVDLALKGKHAPTKTELAKLVELIEAVDTPMLLHCLSGVDRSGMASVIAAMAIGEESYEEAVGELFDTFQYTRGRRDDSVGALFVAYEAYHQAAGTATGGWSEFRKWALETYYPYYYHVSIVPPTKLQMISTQTLEVPLTITNRSDRSIPFGDEDRSFRVVAFLGTSVNQYPDDLSSLAIVKRDDLKPGETIQLVYKLTAPGPPGSYDVGFDMMEIDKTFFAYQGSPIGRCHVVVTNPESSHPDE